MTILIELKDDLVLISTWENDVWYCWGQIHFDAFYQDGPWTSCPKPAWYQELKKEGKVVVRATFTIDNSMQLPPDNLS